MAVIRGELACLADRVDALEELRDEVRSLAEQMLADLDTERGQDSAGKAAPISVVAWTDLGPEEARTVFSALREWMAAVLAHYPRVVGALRPCWYRHPAAVQVLLDSHAAWRQAYRNPGQAATVRSALDWSQLYLPHLEKALSRELGHCTSVRHDPATARLPSPDEHDIAAYLHWWTTSRDPAEEPSEPGATQ